MQQRRSKTSRTFEIGLQRIKNFGVVINSQKSIFFQLEVRYLGRIISNDRIKADISTIKALKKKEMQENHKKVQKLLGMINWFRNFLTDLSKKIFRINEKLKDRNKKLKWNKKDTAALENIMEDINKQIQLKHADLFEEFKLQTDACDIGISGILYQDQGIIGIYSRKLLCSERNYTTMEKEILAIVRSIQHFKYYIMERKIKILTDKKNLTFLKSSSSQ